MMTTSKTVYTNDRGEALTEEEFVAWCEREEAARVARYARYQPVMDDE